MRFTIEETDTLKKALNHRKRFFDDGYESQSGALADELEYDRIISCLNKINEHVERRAK